jgi:hypothetical protein
MTWSVEVDSQARVDTLVRSAPGGEERRRTEYQGTVWFDGRPVPAGMRLARAHDAPKGIRMPGIDTALFVPDSLPYARERLGGAELSVFTALQASGGGGAVLRATPSFADDPSGAPTWVQLRLEAYGPWPFGIAYRVVALTPVDAVV